MAAEFQISKEELKGLRGSVVVVTGGFPDYRQI
jgi:hypothetical protein